MTPVFAPAKPVWLCISRPQRLLGLIWRHPISSLTSMAAQLPCTVINTVRPLHDSSFVLIAASKASGVKSGLNRSFSQYKLPHSVRFFLASKQNSGSCQRLY